MSPCGPDEVTFLEALSVVLQHPAVAADQQVICRLMQVCKAWRAAVQQSDAGLTLVSCTLLLRCGIDQDAVAATVSANQLVQFAQWLVRYAGTIRSINVDIQGVMAYSAAIKGLIALAQSILGLGLTAAVRTGTLPRCSSTTLAADAAESVVSRPLQLRSFTCSNFLAGPSLLSALPAATLTQLKLEAPILASAIHDYYELREATGNPNSWSITDVGLSTIDLVHLTALQQLHVQVSEGLTALRLPLQLSTLQLTYCNDATVPVSFASPQLQLQQLAIDSSKHTAEDLLALKQLQQLSKLELGYTNMDCVLQAAPAWPQLKQLVGLNLHFQAGSGDVAAAAAAVRDVFQVIGQVTQLQELQLDLVSGLELQKRDIMQLSSLTNLKQLRLHLNEQCRAVLDSPAVSSLLQQLSGLEHLSVYQLRKVDALPAVGGLRQLTYLHLFGLPQNVQQQGLGYLAGLHKLQELRGFEKCSDETLKQFWAGIRS